MRALRRIRKSETEDINVDFSVFKMKGGGIYQYYKSSLSQLGLIIDTKPIPLLTDKGKQLAQTFENNIRNSTYFKNFLESKVIPKEVLKGYGKIANFIYLKNYKKEREQLLEILFNRNQIPSDIEFSRRDTLLFILDLFQTYEENKKLLNNDDFRCIIHYGVSSKNVSYSTSSTDISRILSYWRFFTFHNYLTFGLENILYSFILTTSKNEEGITEEEFIKNHRGFTKIIGKYLNQEIELMILDEVINCILKKCNIKKSFDILTSREFDEKVGIDSLFSEFNIMNNIKILDQEDTVEVVGFSILLILITLIRYRHYIDTFDDKMIWINEISDVEVFNQNRLFNEIRNNLKLINLNGLFRLLLRKIINQHWIIAQDKEMSYGLDTYRFFNRGNKYFFKQFYTYSERSDKFNAIKNLLEDLGLIEYINEYYHLTIYGKDILKRYNCV